MARKKDQKSDPKKDSKETPAKVNAKSTPPAKKKKSTFIVLEVGGKVEVKAYEADLKTVRTILNPAMSKAEKDMSRLAKWIIKHAPEDLLGKNETVDVVLEIMERNRVAENLDTPDPEEIAGLDPVADASVIASMDDGQTSLIPPVSVKTFPPSMEGVGPGVPDPSIIDITSEPSPENLNPTATDEPDTVAPTVGPGPEPGYEHVLTVAEIEELNRYLVSHVTGVNEKQIITTILQYGDGLRAKQALNILKEKEALIRGWEEKKVNMMVLMAEYKGKTKAELLSMAKDMAKPRLCQLTVDQLKTHLKNHIV